MIAMEYGSRSRFLRRLVSYRVGFNPTYLSIQKLCSPNDKGDCLRQWVSASSGWFGGAITLATLIVLSRQVNDVRTHHRETIAQAKLPVYLRAKRVVDATAIARITLELIADAVTTAEQNGPTTNGLFRMRAGIKSLKNDVSRPEFDSLEPLKWAVASSSACDICGLVQRTSVRSRAPLAKFSRSPRRQS